MQEIMIKIDESRYRLLQKQARTNLGKEKLDEFAEAVLNGTALPKGHGRLIDADVLVDGMEDDYEFCEAVNATPTIIEAERSEE